MASYNKFHQKSFRATAICIASGGFTSFYNGLVVLTILGFIAHDSGTTVEAIASASGPSLAFVAFPTALSRMPIPHLWSVLFFLTLVTVVFDSLFGMFEAVTSGLIDLYPRQLTKRRALVNILAGLAFFLACLPLTMNGGIYLFQLSDWYFSSFALLVGTGLEAFSICLIYGAKRFSRDISLMTGRSVSVLLRVVWGIVIPVIVLITFLVMLSKYSAPTYGDGNEYDSTAIGFGIAVGLVPIIGLIAVAGWKIVQAEGSFARRITFLLRPSDAWIPNDRTAARTYHTQPYQYGSTLRERFLVNIRGKC